MRRLFALLALSASLFVAGLACLSQPRAQLMMMTGAGLGAPATAGTTWDPANKSTNTVLSGGNLTAAGNGSAGLNDNVRDTVGHSTGKYYSEHLINAVSVNVGFGVVNSSFTIGANYVGETNNGIAFFNPVGLILLNGGSVGTLAGGTVGDIICMAVDLDNKSIWWRVNNGAWINSGDPATNFNGADMSVVLGSGTRYAAFEVRDPSNSSTSNFGATGYSFTPPSGFGNW